MQRNKIFDALVVDGGPAGIAAAMALARACRTVALFDSQEYRNPGVPMTLSVMTVRNSRAGHDTISPSFAHIAYRIARLFSPAI
ncbi:hypothetical protein V1519DRAFT_477485, partial [Lipomyces tetrasporus]